MRDWARRTDPPNNDASSSGPSSSSSSSGAVVAVVDIGRREVVVGRREIWGPVEVRVPEGRRVGDQVDDDGDDRRRYGPGRRRGETGWGDATCDHGDCGRGRCRGGEGLDRRHHRRVAPQGEFCRIVAGRARAAARRGAGGTPSERASGGGAGGGDGAGSPDESLPVEVRRDRPRVPLRRPRARDVAAPVRGRRRAVVRQTCPTSTAVERVDRDDDDDPRRPRHEATGRRGGGAQRGVPSRPWRICWPYLTARGATTTPRPRLLRRGGTAGTRIWRGTRIDWRWRSGQGGGAPRHRRAEELSRYSGIAVPCGPPTRTMLAETRFSPSSLLSLTPTISRTICSIWR